jgi:hypothetical protein
MTKLAEASQQSTHDLKIFSLSPAAASGNKTFKMSLALQDMH